VRDPAAGVGARWTEDDDVPESNAATEEGMTTALRVLVLCLALALLGAVRPPGLAVETTVNDDKGKPIDEAVVYLLSPAPAPPRVVLSATMDQQDKEFIPHVLPVEVGTSVHFPNRDNIRHHVYSFSPAKKFELPLYIGTPANPVLFDQAGPVSLGCNIHDWMVGHIIVLPTPYFAKTGADGRARIQNVPSGVHEIRVWHPRMKAATETTGQRLTLGQGSPTIEPAFVLSLKRDFRPARKTYEQAGSN
jgi:plastocyanin